MGDRAGTGMDNASPTQTWPRGRVSFQARSSGVLLSSRNPGERGVRNKLISQNETQPFWFRTPAECGHALQARLALTLRLLIAPLLFLGAVACEGPTEGNNNGDPAVWPQAARLGDSVGWVISNELLASSYPAPTPAFTWSRDNVEIGLVDEVQNFEVTLVPRVVFEAQSATGASLRGADHGVSVGAVIAMFDLPDPWPNASSPNPSELALVLYVDGEEVPGWVNTIDVLGSGGAPTAFGAFSDPDLLASRPMLRLRPRWNSGRGLDPDWNIAGIEFTLIYPEFTDAAISHPRAIPAGDASTALTLTGPVTLDGATNRVRVNVLVPGGFKLSHDDCDPSGCYSGHTALIDIAFDKNSGSLQAGEPVFTADDFEIWDIRIVDPAGVQLNDTTHGPTYFDSFVVNNLSEGE